jgi:hypothetical protein
MQKRHRDNLEIEGPPLCCLVHGDPKESRCLHCGATICPQCRTYYHRSEYKALPQVSNHFFNGVCRVRSHKDILDKEEAIWNATQALRKEKSRFVTEQLYEKAAKARDLEVNVYRGDIGKRQW